MSSAMEFIFKSDFCAWQTWKFYSHIWRKQISVFIHLIHLYIF